MSDAPHSAPSPTAPPMLSLDELLRRANEATRKFDDRKRADILAAADDAMAEFDRRAEIYRTRDMAGLAGLVLDGHADIEEVEHLLCREVEDTLADARHDAVHGTPQEIAQAEADIRAGEAKRDALLREWAAALAEADDEEAAHEAGIEWTPPHVTHTAATSSLPAYYDRPAGSREQALARQEAGMLAHAVDRQRIIAARRELRRRRTDAINAAGGEDALSSRGKAALTKRIHREVAEARGWRVIPLPPRLFVTGAQGSGKTTFERKNVDRHAITWITEPSFTKCAEEYGEYLRELRKDPSLPPAALIRGRGRADPMKPGHRMCPRHVAAERVARAGLSVVKTMCTTCPLQNECGDRRQEREARAMEAAGRGVVFMASEYLYSGSPAARPDHAVADENITVAAAEVITVPLAALNPYEIANAGHDTRNSMASIVGALARPDNLQAIRDAGIDRREMRTLIHVYSLELERRTPDISGRMTNDAIVEALDGSTRGVITHVLTVLRAVAKEIGQPRRTLSAVHVRDDTAIVSRLRKIHGLKHASLTCLDGTGDFHNARELFGSRLQHLDVRFPRRLHVIGTKGKSYSRKSVTGLDRNGKPQEWREGGADRVRGDISKIHAQLPAGAAIFASKRPFEALYDTGAVPQDTPGMHFGKLRGRNELEHVRAALVVGAETLALRALEDKARAYLASDPVPFVSMDYPAPDGWGNRRWPYTCTRMRRMSGGKTEPVEVEVHPDPRVQRFYEQVREAEVIQAIDRLRPIWNPRQVILLNSLVIDVDYDAIYTHRDLVAGGNRIERAFLASGIVPRSPDLLHRMHPALFRSAKAAAHALHNYPLGSGGNSILETGVVSFRLAGRHGPEARAWIDLTRHPDPQAALEAAFGPLQSFQGVACGEPAEARGKWRPSRRKPLPYGGLGRITMPPSPWDDPDWRPGRILDG